MNHLNLDDIRTPCPLTLYPAADHDPERGAGSRCRGRFRAYARGVTRSG
ncbi:MULTISPECIES: hypothetical protein [Paracoccus]|nr:MULTISPECIES: hypothetical protein [Paracoccus]